jgi:hypothetical protein
MKFDNMFLIEHDARMVEDSKDKEVLLWAHKKRYIVLLKTPSGKYAYTKHDLQVARMWREKDET